MAKRKAIGKKNTAIGLIVFVIGAVLFVINALFPDLIGNDGTKLIEQVIAPIDATCSVHFIDVGQGDSTLIKSDGYNILIDAGENDKGVDVVRYLKEQNVEKLDLIISTHPHSDHMGGLDTVINHFPVDKVLVNRLPKELVPTTKTYTDFLNAVKDNDLKLTASNVGDEFNFGNGKVTIIGPTKQWDDLNNTSIVAKFEYDNKSFLFTGDMEKQSEQNIIDNGIFIESDVLKIAHHGSSTSTTTDFLNSVNPQIAVISVADENKYGHPNAKAVDRIEQNGTDIYRTDYNGTVVISIDNGKTYISCEK